MTLNCGMYIKTVVAISIIAILVVSFLPRGYSLGESICINGGQTYAQIKKCFQDERIAQKSVKDGYVRMQSDMDKNKLELKHMQVQYNIQDSHDWVVSKFPAAQSLLQDEKYVKQGHVNKMLEQQRQMLLEFQYWQKYGKQYTVPNSIYNDGVTLHTLLINPVVHDYTTKTNTASHQQNKTTALSDGITIKDNIAKPVNR